MNDKCFMAGTLAALASALIVGNSIDHMSDPPLIPNSVRSASMHAPPAANAEANLCAVRCPGYTEPLDGPTTLAEAQAMAASQRAAAAYWIGQKGTKSRGPTANSAAPAQPRQPSTTVTVKQSTTSTAKGTTTASTTTTTKRTG